MRGSPSPSKSKKSNIECAEKRNGTSIRRGNRGQPKARFLPDSSQPSPGICLHFARSSQLSTESQQMPADPSGKRPRSGRHWCRRVSVALQSVAKGRQITGARLMDERTGQGSASRTEMDVKRRQRRQPPRSRTENQHGSATTRSTTTPSFTSRTAASPGSGAARRRRAARRAAGP